MVISCLFTNRLRVSRLVVGECTYRRGVGQLCRKWCRCGRICRVGGSVSDRYCSVEELVGEELELNVFSLRCLLSPVLWCGSLFWE